MINNPKHFDQFENVFKANEDLEKAIEKVFRASELGSRGDHL